ncbi:MAG: AmmeMemoRadiSam system protein B [Candidatus Omnitrophica bacterium]|nr:AmmeMemoRadiSam system protein B [Candidatus Omnitrophota bacterium]
MAYGDEGKIPNSKSQITNNIKYQMTKITNFCLVIVILVLFIVCDLCIVICDLNFVYADDVKQPNVAGQFYPDDPVELSLMIDNFLKTANPEPVKGDVFSLISPHAGYGYSGQVAAYGYKLIKDKPYKTVIVIGASHQYAFSGVSVYPEGAFRTPLGDVEIDKEFTGKLLNKDSDILFDSAAFQKEHSVEVQLPFLQKALSGPEAWEHIQDAALYRWKVVPIVMGDCAFSVCQKLANLLKAAIGSRKDVLVVASSDMYHGYDYKDAQNTDNLTLSYLKNMDAEGLYYGLREAKLQLCGGFGVVTTLILSKELGHHQLRVLNYANSGDVTGKKTKGAWIVGYASCAIDQEKGESAMLNKEQRRKLLEIARKSIETYLKTGKKLETKESDPALLKEMGAFVTLRDHANLRGCIGNLAGNQPLYLAIRDMAIEAATGDPRFLPMRLEELENIEIEISALSPLQKISDPDKIELGIHGVLVKRGFQSGVFLPQVATETGWTKEEFLSNLCAQKAGLSPDSWKDKSTEIYIFTAEVFAEESY